VTSVSAEPIDFGPPRPWQPDPIRQRRADHTLEDIINLPEDTPRVELYDGVMRVVPSPTEDHQDIAGLLWAWLRANAPREFKATTAVGMAVSTKKSFEPDVLLKRADGIGDRHLVLAENVVIAVEVVSPGTERTDRLDKPFRYAEAGVPFYWRVEQHPVRIYTYKLSDGIYKEQANSADELVVDEPFPIRLPIRDITP
jgi:Uma2 family endonuclease